MASKPRPLSSEDHDILLAEQLAAHLRAGGQPAPQSLGIRMYDGEEGYGTVQGELHIYTGAQYVDPGSFFVAFGSPMWMLGTLGASALMNSRRRSKAQAAAAHQWRLENQGVLHVTSQRLAMQGVYGWLDLDYRHFQAATPTELGIVAHFADWPMVLISSTSPAWLWVILSKMVLGQVPEVTVSPELRDKARLQLEN